VHLPVLIAGSLLHDAGKAEEYKFNPVRGRYEMTERGALLGHKHTVLEWIAAARAQHRVIMPEAHYLALLHAITAAKGAPDWLGLREPLSLDAHILSTVDRLSGQADLVSRHAARDGGFGVYHRHLGGRPYVVRE
jgi:3'-5' exoribonuclease